MNNNNNNNKTSSSSIIMKRHSYSSTNNNIHFIFVLYILSCFFMMGIYGPCVSKTPGLATDEWCTEISSDPKGCHPDWEDYCIFDENAVIKPPILPPGSEAAMVEVEHDHDHEDKNNNEENTDNIAVIDKPILITDDNKDTVSFTELFTREIFYNYFFKNVNNAKCNGMSIFNYDGLISASKEYPDFGNTGIMSLRKREIAAFFAHVSQITSGGHGKVEKDYTWGLCYGQDEGCNNYDGCVESGETFCDPKYEKLYPCVEGKSYHGRGPFLIRGNKMYGKASEAIFGDKTVLLESPEKLMWDDELAMKTAIWIWMTEFDGNPSCHDAIAGKYEPGQEHIMETGQYPGFGLTINILDSRQCHVKPSPEVIEKLGYYNRYCDLLSVTPGHYTSCKDQDRLG